MYAQSMALGFLCHIPQKSSPTHCTDLPALLCDHRTPEISTLVSHLLIKTFCCQNTAHEPARWHNQVMLTGKTKPNFQGPVKAWGHPISAGKRGSVKGRDWHKCSVLNTCNSLPQQFWLRYGRVLTSPCGASAFSALANTADPLCLGEASHEGRGIGRPPASFPRNLERCEAP